VPAGARALRDAISGKGWKLVDAICDFCFL